MLHFQLSCSYLNSLVVKMKNPNREFVLLLRRGMFHFLFRL